MIKSSPKSLTNLKVLIVEDEALIAEEIRERLQRLGAVVLDVVDTGQGAIDSVEAELPELILMDIRLKGDMSGVQAAEIIQSRFRVPLIYLTAHSDWETVQQAKSGDPFGYLLKPFNEADLVSTIETASRRQELEQRLSDSEKRFKATLDSLDEGVITVDIDSTVSFFNPMAEKLTGWSASDVLGRPLREVFSFSQDGAPAPGDELLPFLHSDSAVGLRGTLHSRLGRDVPLRLTVAPVVDSASRVRQRLGAVLTFQDLTEQLQIGEQMRHSEERVSAVFNNSPAAMSIVSLDDPGVTLDVNKSFESMTGYTREQVLSTDHAKSAFWQAEFDFLELYEDFRKHGKVSSRDFEYRHANGEIRAGLISASPFTIDGKSYVLTSIMDITDRKRTEDLLRQSEEKFHAIFNQSFQFIGLLDTDGVVLETNQTALDFIDASPDDIIGKRFWDTPWWSHSVELQEKLRAAVQRAARGEVIRMEVTHPDAEGRQHYVDFSLKPVKDASGTIALLIPEGRDITELKEMQTSLQVSEAEKSELQANYLQSQKMEAVGRLAAGVAHDFNNLLTVINGYADLIDQGAAGGGEAPQLISEIRAAGQRASGLTRQLLAFSRKQVLEPVRVDLRALIKDLGQMLERLLGEDVILTTSTHEELWPINVDPNQLEQVIVNLAVNARDAMNLGGTLLIEAENAVLTTDSDLRAEGQNLKPGHYVVLRVRDNGCGIEPEILGHIFEPFFTTKDQSQGTGLGLATVYGIVKQSGGAVRVNSTPNSGTIFELFFPGLAEEEIKVSEKFEARNVATGSETILLVEDDEGVRELMTTGLSMLGYKIHAACNGQDALEILSEHDAEIGLMVTDVVMPGMSGGELAELTRERHPDIKVLFLSGYNNDEVVKRGVTQGDIRLLRKPFTIDEFSQVVREELDA
jgi:PAS domain S-box-containing protein